MEPSMDPLYLPGVLLLDGHYATPSAAIDEAVTWLTAHGVSDWDSASARLAMSAVLAWYDDEGHQFVQEGHACARPVTAVNMSGNLVGA